MGRLSARVLILLTIALALSNLHCLAQCLAQPTDNSNAPMPCHSHGKPHVDARQHDLELVTAHSTAPAAWNSLAWIDGPADPVRIMPESFRLRTDSWPPPFLDNADTSLPLRI